ncbi:putative tail fiber protein [Pelagibacter phage HTVC026P]|nr:putative tail fiber protein [Pelagibacter phage HTVC026P]
MPLIKLNATQGLTGTLPAVSGANLTNIDGGKVLQVVQGTLSTSVTTNSSSFSDVGLSATITPSSSSNKILILVDLNGVESRDNRTWLDAKLLRGSTDIVANFGGRAGYGQKYGYTDSDYHRGVGAVTCSFLDSPSTTSATTYKIQYASNVNVQSIGVCSMNCSSFITLMEVSA